MDHKSFRRFPLPTPVAERIVFYCASVPDSYVVRRLLVCAVWSSSTSTRVHIVEVTISPRRRNERRGGDRVIP